MSSDSPIDDKALDSLSVAPAGQDAGQEAGAPRRGDAGRDPSLGDDSLDEALDESMDASDPPAATQPGRAEPAPSSGFDAAEEAERQRDA
ncbi:hypothetical protein [Sphingomonas adhaesiva]|uniref:hypothetical protein n=1 Tax=Sphingomonas adhaesiva TaxID=28212 RepID=UPI002FFACE2B